MNLTKMMLVTILLLTLTAVGCNAVGQERGFSNEDKTEIVRLSLERALVAQEIPDYVLLVESGDAIVLSSENMVDVQVPEVSGHEIIVLSPDEIQAKADTDGDFLYLHFNPFDVETADKVNVGFGNQWAVSQDSTNGYLSGGGMQMVYERQADGWTGEVEAIWMS